MEATLNARSSLSPRRGALLALVLTSLACAPVSWLMDGLTPSFVVYPLVLIVGLWLYRRGRGTLFFGIAATIFLIVHLPFAWAAITDSGKSPANASSPYNPREWLVTLFAIPLITAIAGFLAWREPRRQPRDASPFEGTRMRKVHRRDSKAPPASSGNAT